LQNLVLDIVGVAHKELHLVHSFFEPPRNQLIKNGHGLGDEGFLRRPSQRISV
jgi:hypothetical protein